MLTLRAHPVVGRSHAAQPVTSLFSTRWALRELLLAVPASSPESLRNSPCLVRPAPIVICKSFNTSAASTSASEPGGAGSNNRGAWVAAFAAIACVAVGVAAMASPQGIMMKDVLVNGPLGRSGFLAAFSLIFLSEIGDKTFFIAALLAMKVGKWISFGASLASLSLMTLISVAIGVVFSRVPDALKSSVPVGEIAGCALLVFFGIRALREGLKADSGEASGADEELAEADEAVKAAEEGGRMRRGSSPVKAFMEVATLIFVAEWGDRSMLATVALGAAQNPFGVATGAIVGHAIATGIAVLGGAMASKHVSEKQINIASGVLFLLFAGATVISML